MFLKKIISS